MPAAARGPVLILGGNGQVGWELRRALAPMGSITATGRAEIDLAEPDQIRRGVRDVGPCLIVNAAAHTAVDRAEEEESELAMAVNGRAPGILAEEAKRLGVPLIHYSTDFVFDGHAPADGTRRPYTEADPTGPLNVYGASKLAGEEAIHAVGPAHLILRTSWVYATRGHNFMRTIQRMARDGAELRVIDDQIGCPTWARALAEATAAILAQSWLAGGSAALAERGGLFHLSAAGETSWHGFASAIVAASVRPGDAPPKVRPIPTSGYPLPARRPAYSVFDCSAVRAAFGVALPHWEAQLGMCLDT